MRSHDKDKTELETIRVLKKEMVHLIRNFNQMKRDIEILSWNISTNRKTIGDSRMLDEVEKALENLKG